MLSPAQLARFESKVHAEPMTGCHLWVGATFRFGYGCVRIKVADGSHRSLKSHRVAYEHWVGPIPDGMCVLHKCDTPACVNPEHLAIGTQSENLADMRQKGRWKCRGPSSAPRKTHCLRGHEYTDANTYMQRRGDAVGVSCRTCKNLRAQEKRANA